MAAVSVTLTRIQRDGDRVLVSFGKRTREFASIADLRDFVANTLSRDVLEALFLRLALDRQPNLDNPAQLEGHTLTVDTSLANWGRVS